MFFGYASSLIVALTLVVFYIGNVAQYITITKAKPQSITITSGTVTITNKTTAYFAFETHSEYVTKAVKLANVCYLLSVKHLPVVSTISYYSTNDGKPPLTSYKATIFSRPPPKLA